MWHHVPTKENPNDLGTRGIPPAKLDEFWLKGPDWLINEEFWPNQPEITQTEEAVAEIIPKQTEKTLLATANQVTTEQQEWTNGMLQKYGYWKLCRITAWMKRFTDNRRLEHKLCGPPGGSTPTVKCKHPRLKISEKGAHFYPKSRT